MFVKILILALSLSCSSIYHSPCITWLSRGLCVAGNVATSASLLAVSSDDDEASQINQINEGRRFRLHVRASAHLLIRPSPRALFALATIVTMTTTETDRGYSERGVTRIASTNIHLRKLCSAVAEKPRDCQCHFVGRRRRELQGT